MRETSRPPLHAFALTCLLLALCIPLIVSAEPKDAVPEQFRLLSAGKSFRLDVLSGKKSVVIPLDRKWLIPPDEEKEDENSYVSAFRYEKDATAFAIGNGEIGLHLSSYDIQTEGSADAAAGKDIFLVYNPETSHVTGGLTSLGITKNRVRSSGCFQAENSLFILADVNGDGLTDIGVILESISCDESPKDANLYQAPQCTQKPVRWYLYSKGKWDYSPANEGKWTDQYKELPLIGLERGPVDFVASVLWDTCDPSKWKTADGKPPAYTPGYRKTLLEEEE